VLDSSIFDRAGMDDSVLAPKQWDVNGYADGKDVTADTGLHLAPAAGSVVSTAFSKTYGPGTCCHGTWLSR
jgi:hypothetical protein